MTRWRVGSRGSWLGWSRARVASPRLLVASEYTSRLRQRSVTPSPPAVVEARVSNVKAGAGWQARRVWGELRDLNLCPLRCELRNLAVLSIIVALAVGIYQMRKQERATVPEREHGAACRRVRCRCVPRCPRGYEAWAHRRRQRPSRGRRRRWSARAAGAAGGAGR